MMLCSSCEIRLTPSRMGVYVVEENECGPSTIWKADEMACPKCGNKVVCNFSTKPLAEYWNNKPFQELMKVIKQRPGNVVHCREFNAAAAANGVA